MLGNEASGLSQGVLAALDAAVTIPMAGRAESLNVGVSAAVLCFEALRQRRSRTASAGRRGHQAQAMSPMGDGVAGDRSTVPEMDTRPAGERQMVKRPS